MQKERALPASHCPLLRCSSEISMPRHRKRCVWPIVVMSLLCSPLLSSSRSPARPVPLRCEPPVSPLSPQLFLKKAPPPHPQARCPAKTRFKRPASSCPSPCPPCPQAGGTACGCPGPLAGMRAWPPLYHPPPGRKTKSAAALPAGRSRGACFATARLQRLSKISRV